MDEQGSITPQVLILFLFLAALLCAAVPYMSVAMVQHGKAIARYTTQKMLETAVQRVIDKLDEDQTPESDWRGDLAQQYVLQTGSAVKVSLRDISSRINPNYFRKKMLEQTKLRSLLRPNTDATILQQYRYDEGPASDPDEYKQFFRNEAKPYLTCVGWANINTTDEFMLRSLYESMTGSASDAEEFHRKIQSALVDQRVFDEDSVYAFFGEDALKIWPVINADPWFNVNFTDPYLLSAIIEYPEYSIAEAEEKTSRLLELRGERELSRYDIASILGIGTDHALMQYLGTTTAFWEVSAQLKNITYTVIVARLPESTFSFSVGGNRERRRYVVVERRYEP